jgi:pyruvate formate lyase activating enzyme
LNAPPDPGREAAGLRVGGLEKLSLVDWPGLLSAVVFCQGCAWRCRYCHNPHLLPFGTKQELSWPGVVRWLERRRGLLDGVVFSGGEATCQTNLAGAMAEVRDLGFQVGLHTGGPAPWRIAQVAPLVDWVGFDFKAPFADYARVTGGDHGPRARESLRLILEAGVACEIRTTWHPALLSAADLSSMADTLSEMGCSDWVIQRFRPDGCADANLCAAPAGAVPEIRARDPGLRITVR